MGNSKMNKILWISNKIFSGDKCKETASWLQPLAKALEDSKKVHIVNVSTGDVKEPQAITINGIKQWIIPNYKTSHFGHQASPALCKCVADIINSENPDLVHIWGTEKCWVSIYRQGYIQQKTLLDIQGLLFVIEKFYYGGLTFSERLKCIHAKEILMPWRTIANKKRIFKERGRWEQLDLRSVKYISYQSEWVKHHIQYLNNSATYFPTKIMLRDEFYKSEQWTFKSVGNSPVIFSFCSYANTYKGMHVVIKIAHALKIKYPNVRFRLAGNLKIGKILLDGYSIFLMRLIKQYGLQDNIEFLGPLSASELVQELRNANACIISSFIETYCLAFAESMMVGCPTICSSAGAMPELADHEEEALFYTSLDHVQAAALVDRVLQDRDLAERISRNGRQRRLRENDKQEVIDTQLHIYKSILEHDN